MPRLDDPRKEKFCQLIKRGIPARRAYPMAGYRPHPSNPSRLSANERIKRRINELTRHIAVKTRVTIETISEQLDQDRDFARETKQAGAAHAATVTKAKLHGLLVDRKETGAPGDFAGLQSADEVLDVVRKELGDAAADALALVLGTHEAAAPADQAETLEQPRAIDAERGADDVLN